MRIATWNVNGLRARMDLVERWLADRRPDVVLLQEVKLEDRLLPAERLAGLGYRAACHGQKGWNGVAVLARGDLQVARRGLPGYEGMGARLIVADTPWARFASVYVPNGKATGHPDFERKIAWMEGLARHLAELAAGPGAVVAGGDFNVAPGALDTWDEEGLRGTIFHTEQERAAFRDILAGGYVDLFRDQHPDLRAYSWWDYRGGAFRLDHGLRIDFLLAANIRREAVREVWIDREYRKKIDGLTPSDHAPVVADVGL